MRYYTKSLAIILAAMLLASCVGVKDDEGGYQSKLPAPQPETDCQVRIGEIEGDAAGLVARGRARYRTITIIGVDKCPDELPVPGMVPLRIRPSETEPRELPVAG